MEFTLSTRMFPARPGCAQRVIGRNGYEITTWNLDAAGRCSACGLALAGQFAPTPGQRGLKRQPGVLPSWLSRPRT